MTPIYLPAQPKPRRRWPRVILVLGFLVLSVLLFQPAKAQSPSLKPPFKLIRAEQPGSPELNGPVALPLAAPIVVSQAFDSSYLPVLDPSVQGWHQLVGSGATAHITWKRVTTGPHPDTAWSAGQNLTGADFDPATGTYTNGMEALLVYGPIDLSNYFQVVMTSTYWLDTQDDNFLNDHLGVAYSTDGSTFTELYAQASSDPLLDIAHTGFFNLAPMAGKSHVWLAFTFVTNNDNLVARGAFIKDMVLRGMPYYRIFMPVLRLDPTPTPTNTPTSTPTPTPTATPSATYRYFYTFGNGGPNNSDFGIWGGARSTGTTCNGNACTYYQDIVTLGNPGGAMTMYSYDVNILGGTGPRQGGVSLTTATDFEYSADFYVYTGQVDARYGLVFDASSSTFPDSGNPPFAPGFNYYYLQMHIDTTTRTQVATWQLKRVVNGAPENVTSAAALPISITQGQWHNLKVRQQSDGTMIVFLNGYQLSPTAVYDPNWGDGRRRFGMYIDVRGTNNDGGNPFEVFFDNVAVADLP